MHKLLKAIFLASILVLFSAQMSFAQGKVFTVEELSAYNGKNGAQAYTSYKGVVYDVTDSKLWALGEHFGLQAGKDLTDAMQNAPHGPEVFSGFTVVGTLEGYVDTKSKTAQAGGTQNKVDAAMQTKESQPEQVQPAQQTEKPWYAQRVRIAGFSLLGWSGIVLGVFFVLTFATCFALPWAKLPLPWVGSKIGPDPLDESGTHMVWSSVHKYFVWVTVIVGIIHGILGFLQMVGIYL